MTRLLTSAVLLLALLAACGGEGEATPSLELIEASDDVIVLQYDHLGTEIRRIDAAFGTSQVVSFLADSDPQLTVLDGATFEREDFDDFTVLTIRSEVYALSYNYFVRVVSRDMETGASFTGEVTDITDEVLF